MDHPPLSLMSNPLLSSLILPYPPLSSLILPYPPLSSLILSGSSSFILPYPQWAILLSNLMLKIERLLILCRIDNFTMSYVVGVGYVGPVEPLCERFHIDDDELEVILEEVGLTLFDLDDGRVFVTIKDKCRFVEGTCLHLDGTTATPDDLELILEYTGTNDSTLKICRLESEST